MTSDTVVVDRCSSGTVPTSWHVTMPTTAPPAPRTAEPMPSGEE
jgi:hypothetical protein